MKKATYKLMFPKDECWGNKAPDDNWVDGYLITEDGEKFVAFIGKEIERELYEPIEDVVLDPFTEEQAVKYFESIGYDVTMFYEGNFHKIRIE